MLSGLLFYVEQCIIHFGLLEGCDMYNELDVFENHDDQFEHDGSSGWDELIEEINKDLDKSIRLNEEIPF